MTPDIKAKLIEYLTSLESAVKSSGDFLLEQAPLVAQEYVAYQRGITTLKVCLYILGMIMVTSFVRTIFRELVTSNNDEHKAFVIVPRAIIGIVFLMTFGMGFWMHSVPDEFFKAWFAPRVLLIDYIRSEVAK